MTQKNVTEQSGIIVNTIHKFENGTTGNMSLGTFLSFMKAIGQIDALDDMRPELRESVYLIRDNQNRVQRIKHKKQ